MTNLNPGERIILAKNVAAFAARYPGVTSAVAPFLDTLDNNGETIRLDDAVGEKILDFAYNNSWYPMTDGNGLSLVIVNETAPFNTWGDQASWRPSGEFNGTLVEAIAEVASRMSPSGLPPLTNRGLPVRRCRWLPLAL